MNDFIQSQARHLLASFGAVLVTHGVAAAQVSSFTDAALPVLGGIASWAIAAVWAHFGKKSPFVP